MSVLQLICVSDTVSNWFENHQPQKWAKAGFPVMVKDSGSIPPPPVSFCLTFLIEHRWTLQTAKISSIVSSWAKETPEQLGRVFKVNFQNLQKFQIVIWSNSVKKPASIHGPELWFDLLLTTCSQSASKFIAELLCLMPNKIFLNSISLKMQVLKRNAPKPLRQKLFC